MHWEVGGGKEEKRSESGRLALTGPSAWTGKGKRCSAAVREQHAQEVKCLRCAVRGPGRGQGVSTSGGEE